MRSPLARTINLLRRLLRCLFPFLVERMGVFLAYFATTLIAQVNYLLNQRNQTWILPTRCQYLDLKSDAECPELLLFVTLWDNFTSVKKSPLHRPTFFRAKRWGENNPSVPQDFHSGESSNLTTFEVGWVLRCHLGAHLTWPRCLV